MKAWRELERRWMMHSHAFRTRTLALFALVALLALYKLVSAGGGDSGPEAASLVPADAYAYVDVDLSAEGPGADAAQAFALRIAGPGVEALAGDEVAAALVPGRGGRPETLVVAKPDDIAKARAFLTARMGAGTVTSQRDGFLLAGPRSAVEDAVAAATDPATSVASDPTAGEVTADLPEDPIAAAYISQDGFGVLQERGGAAASLDTFADFGASEGLAAALLPAPGGLELQMSSKLDPSRAAAAPSFFSALPPFTPSLAGLFDPHTLAFLSIGAPSRAVRGLLDQAEAVEPGISAAFNRLDAQLRRSAGIDLVQDLLPALGDQMAAGVAGRRITIAFDGVDPDRARTAVAQLAGPLVSGINPGTTGRAPTIGQVRHEGVQIIEVHISPQLTVSIAAFDRHLLISTDPHGVERAIDGDGGLDVPSDEVSALLFLDLKGLVAASKPLGLSDIRGYRRFRDELAKLGTLVATVRSDEDSLDTD